MVADRFSFGRIGKFKAGLLTVLMLLVVTSPAPSFSQTQAPNSREPAVQYEARGLVRASSRIEYRSDLRAPIAELPVREGQAFAKGDLLVSFDCSRYEAELKSAKAGAEASWIDYKSKKRLLAHQAIGKDEVSLAAAQAGKASAEADVREFTNTECKWIAPFSGRVVALNSNVREYAPTDRPIMTILDDSHLEIEMVVPSNWLVWLNTGKQLEFKVDETGTSVSASIDRLGAEVDPVSQTIKVFGSLEGGKQGILAGMSGTVTFAGGS